MAGVARFASLRNVLLFFAVSTVLFVVGVSQGRGRYDLDVPALLLVVAAPGAGVLSTAAIARRAAGGSLARRRAPPADLALPGLPPGALDKSPGTTAPPPAGIARPPGVAPPPDRVRTDQPG